MYLLFFFLFFFFYKLDLRQNQEQHVSEAHFIENRVWGYLFLKKMLFHWDGNIIRVSNLFMHKTLADQGQITLFC